MTVKTQQVPCVSPESRAEVENLGHGFYRLKVYYGFMEAPDIPQALASVKAPGLVINPEEITYFLGRETIIPTKYPGMAIWREKIFSLISRNATSAAAYFCLPTDRVVEMGEQIEI